MERITLSKEIRSIMAMLPQPDMDFTIDIVQYPSGGIALQVYKGEFEKAGPAAWKEAAAYLVALRNLIENEYKDSERPIKVAIRPALGFPK